ncbi:hypothetical protein MPH48_14835 [Lysinibacillus fusiformis]|uniref:hypothetical protein n=1 Tax=Lysinibacillus fusiformis TaxID=28031 RepID=UPI001F4E16E6|nr:hypothetical protein [Lysinibacillus fusiformis]MCK1989369.1 hypothetical protein [Lysinibacillus fusiformis]
MNRTELRKLKRDARKNDDCFQWAIQKYIYFSFNDASQILDLFINDAELLKKMNKWFFPNDLKILNERPYYNANLNENEVFEIAIHLIKIYSDKINLYLDYKTKYEHLLFVGNYEEAYEFLLKIENDISISIWSLGQKMLIKEKSDGLEENKKLLESSLKATNKNILINTILEFYSNIAEKNMSYLNYQDKVKKFLDSFGDEELDNMLKDYFNFKLNLDLDSKYVLNTRFESIIQIDSQITIIDLYNSFIEIIQLKSYHEKFDELKSKILPLLNLINDNRIKNIFIKFGQGDLTELGMPIPIDYSVILEKYTIGNYREVIELGNEYLKNKSNDFQLTLILIKSKIQLMEFEDFENPVYNDLYNILTINEFYKDSLSNLYGYMKLYSGTSWKYKLKGFVKRKLENSNAKITEYTSYINDLVITPNFASIIEDLSNQEHFLEFYSQYYPSTCELFKYKFGFIEDLNSIPDLDIIRKTLFISRKKIDEGEYEEAIKFLLSINNVKFEESYYMLERTLKELLKAFFKKDALHDCLKLIIDSYFLNKNLIKRYNVEEIAKKIKRTKDPNIKSSIMYPILFHINDENDYKSQRIAFSNYLDYNNVASVTDILKINNDNNRFLIYFLHKICIQHHLKRDIRLANDSSAADEVRIAILKILIDLDASNKKAYFDEVNTIMTRQGIRTRMKQINESKVYVDVENIKQENREILLENFKKYILVKKFDEEVKGVDITSESFMERIRNVINQKIETDVQYSQEVIILRGIISRITEEYLYNEKYGLNTFLSSRIRHGYINSQLTTLFYEHNLMSKSISESSDIYSINEYLDENVIEENEEFEKIREFLSDFTITINKKVLEVKDEWVKIRYHSKDKGLFDFSDIVDNVWMTINIIDDSYDFDIIFNFVINVLKDNTKQILDNLRNDINTELKQYFLDALNRLEMNLKKIDTPETNKIIAEINKNINLCKVKFESVIKEFSEVFYLRDISFVDFTMEDLVTTCLEIISRLNSNFGSVHLRKDINITRKFDGKSFLYFVDILNVFLNNAIEHSEFDDLSKLNLDIEISEDNKNTLKDIFKESKKTELKEKEYIKISVTNNLDSEIEYEKIETKVDSVFKNLSEHEILKKFTQTEGGSGLYKVANILMYNIGLPHTILYEVEDNYFNITLIIAVDELIEAEV